MRAVPGEWSHGKKGHPGQRLNEETYAVELIEEGHLISALYCGKRTSEGWRFRRTADLPGHGNLYVVIASGNALYAFLRK